MKFKLCFLTLLVIGLVLGLSADAFATKAVTVSYDSTKNPADGGVTIEAGATGITATTLTYTNTGTETVTVDSLRFEFGGVYAAAGDANYSLYLDDDNDGILTLGDTVIKTVGLVPVTTTKVAVNVTNFTIAKGAVADVIIVVDFAAGIVATNTIIVGATSAAPYTDAQGVTYTNAAAPNDPDPAGNVPTITAEAAGAGTLDMTELSTQVVADTDVPNHTWRVAVVGGTFTPSDATAKVLTAIGLEAGAGNLLTGDLSGIIDSVFVFLDNGETTGSIDAADTPLLQTINQWGGAANATIYLTGGLLVTAGTDIIVGVSLNGSEPTGNVVDVDIDKDATWVNGVVGATEPVAGPVGANGVAGGEGDQTLVAMTMTASTKDFVGHSYNASRPNGYLDAVLLEFTVSAEVDSINDSSIDPADFVITVGNTNATRDATDAFANTSFVPTYQGDTINDEKVYIKFAEKVFPTDTPDGQTADAAVVLDYTVTTKRIVSDDGEYGVADITIDPVPDGAAPAPISITTGDTDGNGKLDLISIQFSEEIDAANSSGEGDSDPSPIVVKNHDEVNAADALTTGADEWDIGYLGDPPALTLNTLMHIVIDPSEDKYDKYNTGDSPAVSFAGGAGVLADAAGNDVVVWAAAHLNVLDGADPTMVKISTKDANVDGHLDALDLTFSEDVTITKESDFLADLKFAGGFETNYSFTSGIEGSGTSTLTVPVTPREEYDSGVRPLIKYGTSKKKLEDDAGNLLAGIDIIIPVAKQSDVIAPDALKKVWLKDCIKPVVAEAKTVDGYAAPGDPANPPNGKIDAYKLTFSEEMEATVANYNRIKVAGNLVTQNATVILGNTVWVKFTEVENGYNTDAKPEITYTIGLALYDTLITDANAGSSDKEDENWYKNSSGEFLASIASGTVIEKDGAAPLIADAKTRDIGYGLWISDDVPKAANAQVDAIEIYFSEPVDTTEVQYDDIINENVDTDLIDEFSFYYNNYTVGDTLVHFASDMRSAIIPVVELDKSPDTSLADFNDELVYTAAGDAKLKDKAGMAVPNSAQSDTPPDIVESDGAPPVPIAAETIDNNHDGFLDGVRFIFSEEPVIGEDDSTLALDSVLMETVKKGNAIDLSSASISAPTATSIQFVGISEMKPENWDTSKLPKAYIGDGSGIKDSAKNEVFATADSVETTDTAAPVLAKAVGQKAEKTILVTFSEKVTDDTGVLLDLGDILYVNIFDEVNPTSIVEITSDKIEDDEHVPSDGWSLTTDKVLTEDRLAYDKIRVVAGLIKDTADNFAIVDTLAIVDPLAPTLSKAETMDVNGDGRIDNIRLTFSENIKDVNIKGYKAPVDTTVAWTSNTGDRWTVTGSAGDYFILGVNFTCSDDAAALATQEQRDATRIYPGKDVYNVDDKANDNIIYLAIREGDVADTDVRPALSMVGNVLDIGTGVGDFSGNAAASISEVTIKDKVGPVIMSAVMTSQTLMTVIMSEELNDDFDDDYPVRVASEVFEWLIGTEKVHNEQNIVKFKEPKDGTVTLEVLEIAKLSIGMPSTIAFKDFGVIQDDNDGVANADSADVKVDVTPPTGEVEPEVAEDALPDAYALSKNYPNPFNPTTTIEYAIPADGAGRVELVIYNINAQKVRTLVDETKEAGYYHVVWDGRSDTGELVSSGIYLYRIVSGNFIKIEKMTFMK